MEEAGDTSEVPCSWSTNGWSDSHQSLVPFGQGVLGRNQVLDPSIFGRARGRKTPFGGTLRYPVKSRYVAKATPIATSTTVVASSMAMCGTYLPTLRSSRTVENR